MRAANLAGLPTPSLVVDVSVMDANIVSTARALGQAGVCLRPHFKTSKVLEVATRQRAAGAIGFTCATQAEAHVLLDAGHDVLWAHQPVGPEKVAFAAEHAERGLSVIVDSLAIAAPLASAAVARGVTLRVLLEVNTGQDRTGVEPVAASEVARQLADLEGVDLRGVLTHEGHLARHGDDRAALATAGHDAGDLLVAVAQSLRSEGHRIDVASVGSTPGMTSTPYANGVTEARPGTYVYFDANQVRLRSCTVDQCALTVVARVVSANRRGTVIIDAGLKAMSSDSLTPRTGAGIVCDPAGRPLCEVDFEEANEEHGFLRGAGTAQLGVGDLVRVVPNHACGTTNMWSKVIALHPDNEVETWTILARH